MDRHSVKNLNKKLSVQKDLEESEQKTKCAEGPALLPSLAVTVLRTLSTTEQLSDMSTSKS